MLYVDLFIPLGFLVVVFFLKKLTVLVMSFLFTLKI
jgi:hypothetical protein